MHAIDAPAKSGRTSYVICAIRSICFFGRMIAVSTRACDEYARRRSFRPPTAPFPLIDCSNDCAHFDPTIKSDFKWLTLSVATAGHCT